MRKIKQKLNRKENEKLMVIPFIISLPLFIGGMVYAIQLRANNTILSDAELVLYMFSLGLIDLVICFGIYEVLYSRKVKKPFLFYLRRFLGRASVITSYFAFMIMLWYILTYLLVTSISWKYSLLISGILASFALALIVKIPKIKNFLKKIEEGE